MVEDGGIIVSSQPEAPDRRNRASTS